MRCWMIRERWVGGWVGGEKLFVWVGQWVGGWVGGKTVTCPRCRKEWVVAVGETWRCFRQRENAEYRAVCVLEGGGGGGGVSR